MTATASNRRAAQLVGISYRRMGLAAFTIGGLLGGIAGVLVGPRRDRRGPRRAVAADLAIRGHAARDQRILRGGVRRALEPVADARGGLILGVVGQLLQGYGVGSFQTQVSLLLMLIIMIFRARALNSQEEAK